MQPPDLNAINSKMGPRPTGVLPKNINYVVLAAIVMLVIVASIFSGKKTTKVEQPKQPAGPSVSQLTAFQQALEKERREAEEAKRRLEALKVQEVERPPAPQIQSAGGASAPDPENEKRRARAAEAPFASNFSIRPTEKDEALPLDHTPQVVLRVEHGERQGEQHEPDRRSASVPRPKESGKLLSAKELGVDGPLFRLFEGTTVQTVLTNRLDGLFTGPVTCIVTKDVFSKDNSALLIPKQSLFIGKASRVDAQNQTRLAVSFKRLLLPNGYSVDLEAAPGLDSAGETGLKDRVNNHYGRTFGISGAIGLLGGLALYAGQGNPYTSGVANAMGGTATNSLSRFLNAVPTITIREGHSVIVYLPSDLLIREYQP
jgi:type IV secretory pathway VirB10-like protein